MFPLRFGSADEFTAVRDFLARVDYAAPEICRRLGIDTIYDFQSIREGRAVGVEVTDQTDLLIRLFMDVELVEWRAVESLLPAPDLAALQELGLLKSYSDDPRQCHATVLLYPTESLYIVSDLNVHPAGPARTLLSDDAVYPAITKNTRHFLSTLPSAPCESFLELCAGTGIGALAASRYAKHAWATDVTERSTRFARFNASLNGIGNCTAAQGDLYDAVPGQRFERIVAHPPYMPALEQKYTFRDGGEDGEQVTRRIIAGLPDHLLPAGRCYLTCMMSDRKGAPIEGRIREMLGPEQGEFDVLVVAIQAFRPTEYYCRLAADGRATFAEVEQRHQIFRRLEVEQLTYCSFVVQRRTSPRAVFTARRQMGPTTGAREVDWLLRWETAGAERETSDHLLDMRPLASPHVELCVWQRMHGGQWVAGGWVVRVALPFALEAKCPAWAGMLVTRSDGTLTVREQLRSLRESGAIPPGVLENELLKVVRAFVAGGFLEIEGFRATAQAGGFAPVLDSDRRGS